MKFISYFISFDNIRMRIHDESDRECVLFKGCDTWSISGRPALKDQNKQLFKLFKANMRQEDIKFFPFIKNIK